MENQIEEQRKDLLAYTNGMVLPKKDLLNLSAQQKLIICQITPEKAIKKGPVGPYVPIGYVERCLNFVSNFNRGLKVQREGVKTYENKNGKTIHDARVLADFYIVMDGTRVERSCYGTRQMYGNNAVSDFAVLEAARSIATKSFADTLGIASDKLSKEFDDRRKIIEGENIEPTDDEKKDALDGFSS